MGAGYLLNERTAESTLLRGTLMRALSNIEVQNEVKRCGQIMDLRKQDPKGPRCDKHDHHDNHDPNNLDPPQKVVFLISDIFEIFEISKKI